MVLADAQQLIPMKTRVVTLAVFLATLAGPLGAQEEARPSGWVGIRVNFITTRADPEHARDYLVVISDVVDGSPAALAGVQAGDTLVYINGDAASPRSFERLRQGLQAGDDVQLAVRRSGSEYDLHLVAGTRPLFISAAVPGLTYVRIDSVRSAILRQADSLRITVQVGDAVFFRGTTLPRIESGITVLEIPETRVREVVEPQEAGVNVTWQWASRFPEPGKAFPFEALIVHSRRTDSIRSEMRKLQDAIDRARRAELRRQRELLVRLLPGERRIDRGDLTLVRLRALQESLQVRLGDEEDALGAVSRHELRIRRVQADSILRSRTVLTPPVPSVEPIAPYLVGRSYLGGAQVTTLNRGLAEYFGVDRGVLVTEVTRGTPAADASIMAGDVIVRVGQRAVGDVGDLRAALLGRWQRVALTVIRRGEPHQVTLSR